MKNTRTLWYSYNNKYDLHFKGINKDNNFDWTLYYNYGRYYSNESCNGKITEITINLQQMNVVAK